MNRTGFVGGLCVANWKFGTVSQDFATFLGLRGARAGRPAYPRAGHRGSTGQARRAERWSPAHAQEGRPNRAPRNPSKITRSSETLWELTIRHPHETGRAKGHTALLITRHPLGQERRCRAVDCHAGRAGGRRGGGWRADWAAALRVAMRAAAQAATMRSFSGSETGHTISTTRWFPSTGAWWAMRWRAESPANVYFVRRGRSYWTAHLPRTRQQ
jgi:hypothetical protein